MCARTIMRIVDIYAGWRRHQSDSLISVPQIKFPDWLVSVTGGLLGGTKINVVAPPHMQIPIVN